MIFNYNILIFNFFLPNDLITCLLYIYLHNYYIIMYLYIGVCLFMFFPFFTINYPPPLHRVSLGHRVWRFTSTLYIYIYSHVWWSTMPIAHRIVGGLRSRFKCITWRDVSLAGYLKNNTMPHIRSTIKTYYMFFSYCLFQ
jgi:hypothetical protein